MSEPRKPDYTLMLKGGKTSYKFELFGSHQFTSSDMQAQAQVDEHDTPTVRVRLNGAWTPPGERKLYTVDEVMSLVEPQIRNAIIEKTL